MSVNGFLLIDKEVDWTSRDVCNKVSKLLLTKKCGHIGTLDPFATGLMVVAIGEGTKALQFVNDNKKTYIAELILGKKTSSGDNTSEVIEEKEIPLLNEEIINDVLKSFIGKSLQTPPLASAIQINGKRLYEYYREGKNIDIPSREIEVYDSKLISFKDNVIIFEISVSKGTYIRTLGEDIALKLGTVGYLNNLRRTKIDDLSITDAYKIKDVTEDKVISILDVLKIYLNSYVIKDDEEYKKVSNGVNLTIKSGYEKLLILDKSNKLIAVYGKIENDTYHCLRGFQN